MNRNSLMEMSGRVMHMVQRVTINQGNDNPMMQTLHVDGMNSEFRKAVERFQHFGFSSVPVARDEQQQGQQSQQGGGTGGDGEANKGPAAEGIVVFPGGQRNHPVLIALDDRRHRPMGLKPGENAQYDDIGQMTLLRRNGLFLLSLDDEQQQQGSSGSARDSSGGGGGTQRMVSLRHIEKQKQKRPGSSGGSGSSGGGGASAGQLDTSSSGSSGSAQNYKHEGDTVNTELRVTKKNIEFRTGDTVVAHHDKDTSKWEFQGKEHWVSSSDKHVVQTKQVNINGTISTVVQGQQVNINGTTGIALSGPTSVNGTPVATTEMFDARDRLIAKLASRVSVLEAMVLGTER
jgi:phage gp45-like